MDYTPGTQTFGEGFSGPKGNVGFTMVFSQKKAKKIANKHKGKEIVEIVAGLDGDFSENCCTIYDGLTWRKYDCWDHSIWATPIIQVEFKDGTIETFECWEKE